MDDVLYIANKLAKCANDFSNVVVLAFGSALHRKLPYSDIDLLIMYQTEQALKEIQIELESIHLELPVDVIYMTPCEERELDFIQNQGCVKIYP